MPRQLRKLQAFPEMPSHFRKCVISAIACDIYFINTNYKKHDYAHLKIKFCRIDFWYRLGVDPTKFHFSSISDF